MRAAMLAMAPMAKQARMEPLAPPERQALMQSLRFLIPLVSQLQRKRALQGLPEPKGLVVPLALTARWVEVFQPLGLALLRPAAPLAASMVLVHPEMVQSRLVPPMAQALVPYRMALGRLP